MAREFDVVSKVIGILEKEIQYILNNDTETYGGYNVVLTNEQQYVKQANRKPKTIFLVVKFLNGSQDYGQQRQPFAINAVTEHNSLSVCQKLMMDFAEAFNLFHDDEFSLIGESSNNFSLKQTVSTVSSLSNFNEVFEGFRSVFYVSGTFLIGENSNPIIKLEVAFNDGIDDIVEEIKFISVQYSFNAQTDSQAFYDTNDFNRTINQVATLSIGFTMYAINSNFYNFATALIFNSTFNHIKDGDTLHSISDINIDTPFTLKVYFKSAPTMPAIVPVRLASSTHVQELREFPANSFTFVR